MGGGKAERFHLVEERRIWADHELKPWKVEMFKVSNESHFEEKLADVIGLYLRPPARATVFSFGEKTWERPLPARIVHAVAMRTPVAAAPAGRGTGRVLASFGEFDCGGGSVAPVRLDRLGRPAVPPPDRVEDAGADDDVGDDEQPGEKSECDAEATVERGGL